MLLTMENRIDEQNCCYKHTTILVVHQNRSTHKVQAHLETSILQQYNKLMNKLKIKPIKAIEKSEGGKWKVVYFY